MALTGAAELVAFVERVAPHAPEEVQQRAVDLVAGVLAAQSRGEKEVTFQGRAVEFKMIRSAWRESGASELCAPWRQVPAHVVPLPGESS